MEATKAQKNASLINHIKEARQKIAALATDIEKTHKSAETDRLIEKLKEADHLAIDRLVELGLEVKLEEAK